LYFLHSYPTFDQLFQTNFCPKPTFSYKCCNIQENILFLHHYLSNDQIYKIRAWLVISIASLSIPSFAFQIFCLISTNLTKKFRRIYPTGHEYAVASN